ncbi:TetR/AcrR family transcriptional regulator [Micropruina sp.]|uniref:TetR/AcrR family transcriptional regulator n=1 Tax=Micropruina sp. TaxID=2737536 RepID=UPI0039E49DDC
MTQREGRAPRDTRRARTDARLAETVGDLLGRLSYAGLTIERVASESGVAKTTIYRRWGTKAEMVFDLAIHRAEEQPSIDTGSLAGDIAVLAGRAVRLVAAEPGRAVLPGLLADMSGDSELTDRLRQGFIAAARDDIAVILDRAEGRGELSTGASVTDVHAALLGIPYAQVHLLGRNDIDALTGSLTAQLLAVLHARPSD